MPSQQLSVARLNFITKLKEGTFIWATLLAMIVFWLIAYNLPLGVLLPNTEFKDRVRWYGILLEVTSIWSIAYELNNSLISAGRRPLVTTFLSWLGQWRFIFVRGKTINLEARMSLGATVSVGIAVARASSPETQEQQLEKLKSAVEALGTRVDALDTKVNANEQKSKEMLEKEMAERASAISALRGTLEEQYFGDVRLQSAALVVLVLSIFFANAPDESAVLFKAVGLGGSRYW
jgi:outer membrane murein-binding lipoprotein Lpp